MSLGIGLSIRSAPGGAKPIPAKVPAWEPFIAPPALIVMGDSLTQNGTLWGRTGTPEDGWQAQGGVEQALHTFRKFLYVQSEDLADTRGGRNSKGCNQGISGARIKSQDGSVFAPWDLYPRRAEALIMVNAMTDNDPSLAVVGLGAGINDINSDNATAERGGSFRVIADMRAEVVYWLVTVGVGAVLLANMTPRAVGAGPLDWATPSATDLRFQYRTEVNAGIAALVAEFQALDYGIELVDADAQLASQVSVPPGQWLSASDTRDNVHLSDAGGGKLALAVRAAMVNLIDNACAYAVPAEAYTTNNLFPNPIFTGTGTLGAGITGVCPSSWQFSSSAAGATTHGVVSALVSNGDGTNDWVITITPSGSAVETYTMINTTAARITVTNNAYYQMTWPCDWSGLKAGLRDGTPEMFFNQSVDSFSATRKRAQCRRKVTSPNTQINTTLWARDNLIFQTPYALAFGIAGDGFTINRAGIKALITIDGAQATGGAIVLRYKSKAIMRLVPTESLPPQHYFP